MGIVEGGRNLILKLVIMDLSLEVTEVPSGRGAGGIVMAGRGSGLHPSSTLANVASGLTTWV